MSLNPIQTGKEVIDQYGRYLLSTFPIAHSDLEKQFKDILQYGCLLYTSPSPRDRTRSRMPSSA